MSVVLEAKNLSKEFKGFFAVKDVDLKVQKGTIHALIGPNGAGKTTCFNLLTKFLQPTSGTISYEGRDITKMNPARIARLGWCGRFRYRRFSRISPCCKTCASQCNAGVVRALISGARTSC